MALLCLLSIFVHYWCEASCITAPNCQRGMRPSPDHHCSVEVSPSTPQWIGVLGGGQLGKMLGIAAVSPQLMYTFDIKAPR